MKAVILTIGDEILIGQIVDTNAAWIASELASIGAEVTLKMTAPDELSSILESLAFAFAHGEVVIMTGGLGPTKDDVTKKALAHYYDCGFTFSEETYERVRKIFEKRNIPLSEVHREQCNLPKAATLLHNGLGTAPGMWFERAGTYLASMPGVPHEMKYVMTHGVLPRLRDMNARIYRQKTIRTAGIGESMLADQIEPVLEGHPVKTAYLPSQGQVRIRLSHTGDDVQRVEAELADAVKEVATEVRQYVFGYDDVTLESAVGQVLREQGLTLGAAESCTGGYFSHMITSIPGSSDYFLGSIISYANEVKQDLLGVPAEVLEAHGAVSEETAKHMAQGALARLACDVAVAVTGIAGPGGGTEEKPVGTVWIAVGDAHNIRARKLLFTKSRVLNIKYTAIYALIMLRSLLLAR